MILYNAILDLLLTCSTLSIGISLMMSYSPDKIPATRVEASGTNRMKISSTSASLFPAKPSQLLHDLSTHHISLNEYVGFVSTL